MTDLKTGAALVIAMVLACGAMIPHARAEDRDLHLPALHGDVEDVKSLIRKGADVNAVSRVSGQTPLHAAAEGGSTEVCNLLIAHGAKLNVKDDWGKTPLFTAAANGNVDAAKVIAAKGADRDVWTAAFLGETEFLKAHADQLSEPGLNQMQPLHLAAAGDSKTAIEALLADGASLAAKDQQGWTPLHHAALRGSKAAAELLLAKGADVEATDFLGRDPLWLAGLKGNTAMIALLTAKGAEPNDRSMLDQKTALHEAANGKTAEMLIAAGADPDARDKKANTPLHDAAALGRVSTVGYLAGRDGVDVNVQNHLKQTPLHLAAHRGHPRVVSVLLAKGAQANAEDNAGQTAMNYAKAGGRGAKVIPLLKEAGRR